MFSWWLTAGGAIATLLTGLLGRSTALADTSVSMVWPAAGVSVLWLLFSRHRVRDVAALVAVTLATLVVSGTALDLAPYYVALLSVQSVIFVLALERIAPQLRHADAAVDTAPNLLALVQTTVLVVPVFGAIHWGITQVNGFDQPFLELWMPYMGRHALAIGCIVTTGLLTVQAVRRRSSSLAPATPALAEPTTLFRRVEPLLLALAMTAWGLHFLLNPETSLVFVPVAMAIWVGSRFSPVTAAWVTAAMSTLIVAAVLRTPDETVVPSTLAGTTQLLCLTICLTALCLAVSRSDRVRMSTLVADAAAATQEQADFLDAVIGSMPEGVLLMDPSGAAYRLNAAARLLLPGENDVRVEDFKAMGGGGLSPNDFPGQRALAGHEGVSADLFYRDGKAGVLSVEAIPLRATTGEVTGAVLIVRDVAEERERSEELATLAEVVAHDLRRPVAVIGSWALALADELDDLELAGVDVRAARLMNNRITRGGDRMAQLIASFLTQAQTGRVISSHVNLGAVIDELVADLDLSGNVTRGAMPDVPGDRVLLRQLLENLVDNALKYARPSVEPAIAISAIHRADSVVIRVDDNGLGVPDQLRRHIFDRFHRGHGAEIEGLGIGLATVRQIAERHGGSVRVLPNPNGAGSRFEIELPRTARTEVPLSVVEPVNPVLPA